MIIENEYGRVVFDYKHDLNDEECELYLPEYYQGHVIELCMIESYQRGNGILLMQAFLAHNSVKDARLIFLDCSPMYSEQDESETMKRLHNFYSKYGFVSKTSDGYSRMWRIQDLPERSFPLFALGIDRNNDLHPVLETSWLNNNSNSLISTLLFTKYMRLNSTIRNW